MVPNDLCDQREAEPAAGLLGGHEWIEQVRKQMAQRGIIVKAVSVSGLAEEAGLAYKNISDVVQTVDLAGITKKVAQLRPIGNIKG